jgi:hypothetical protein
MLVDNFDARRQRTRMSYLHERLDTSLIQLTDESQRVSSFPFGWRQSRRVRRRPRSIIRRWHVLRLVTAPAHIVTLGAKKCVSGFACRHARNTVHKLASTTCPTHGGGNR